MPPRYASGRRKPGLGPTRARGGIIPPLLLPGRDDRVPLRRPGGMEATRRHRRCRAAQPQRKAR
jgi:hypothetical protein